MTDDEQLLRQYTEEASEDAFKELVSRYVNLVYSAALRRTGGDSGLAQDIAQLVFTDLARKAGSFPRGVALGGWLHQATYYCAAQARRTETRRKAREEEARLMNIPENDPTQVWEQLRPLLDEGLDQLGSKDRDALVLRFFKERTFSEIGIVTGTNEEAARKRVTRALEKLRSYFVQRGFKTTSAALLTAISAHAVESAPAGLAATLANASLLGAAAKTGTLLTLLQAMATTKLKVGIASALILASVGIPLVLQHQLKFQEQQKVELIRQKQTKLGLLQAENQRLSDTLAHTKPPQRLSDAQFNELLRLRSEVGQLKAAVAREAAGEEATDLFSTLQKEASKQSAQLKQWLAEHPEENIPEFTLSDWTSSAYSEAGLETELDFRRAMSLARANAELRFFDMLQSALGKFSKKNNGQFPTDLEQLTPFFQKPVSEAILQRYEIVPRQSLVSELQGNGERVVTEKAPVNEEFDIRHSIGLRSWTGADCRVTNRWNSR